MKQHRKTFCIILIFISVVALHLVAQTKDSKTKQADNSFFIFSPDGKYLAKISYVNNKAEIKILETDDMKIATQWQIPDFKPRDLQFSSIDSGKILVTDNRRILIYKLAGNRQKLLFIQPELKNQKIVQAGFDNESDEVVWATQNTIYQTNPNNRKSRELAYVDPLKSSISSFAALKNKEVAVSLRNSKDILVYSASDSENPNVLKGHTSPVFSVLSPFGEHLFSLDRNHELLVWDAANKRIVQRYQLKDEDSDSRLKGFSLDPLKRDLIVTSQTGDKETGRRYSARDLKNGRLRSVKQPIFQGFSKTTLKNFQRSVASTRNNADSEDEESRLLPQQRAKQKNSHSKPEKEKKGNTIYDLAKIEADNGNYEAALDFIKMVPLNDPQFKESRELRKKIYEQIEIQNSLNAARERIQTGNLSSARVLLKNMQTQYPEDPEINRYLSVVEGKLSKNLVVKLIVLAIIFLLLVLLAYLLWRYREQVKSSLKKSPKVADDTEENVKKVNPQRREFILLLNRVKNQLKLATLHDRGKKHLDTLLEMTAKINIIEKKAKLDDKYLADLTERLIALQTKISELTGTGAGKAKTSNQAHSSQQSQQRRKKPASRRTSAKEKPPPGETPEKKTAPDYYQILGISRTASDEEIKKAYRKKMKEYHPDKHSSSDYDWVKSEASRMTKVIQQAFEVLSDPKKRNSHAP